MMKLVDVLNAFSEEINDRIDGIWYCDEDTFEIRSWFGDGCNEQYVKIMLFDNGETIFSVENTDKTLDFIDITDEALDFYYDVRKIWKDMVGKNGEEC